MDDFKDIIVNKFTEESAKDFREKVIARAVQNPEMPIIVYIDSYGGFLDSLTNMLETIEQVPNPIITVCQGKAMSCGAALLAAGDYRYCGRNSRVMVHQGSGGASGPIEGLQNDVNESKRINNNFMELISSRCNMTVEKFRELMKSKLHQDDEEARDMYLPAQAALELGIVDFIGMPHIKTHIQYEVVVAPKKTYSVKKEVLKVKNKTTKKKALKKRVN